MQKSLTLAFKQLLSRNVRHNVVRLNGLRCLSTALSSSASFPFPDENNLVKFLFDISRKVSENELNLHSVKQNETFGFVCQDIEQKIKGNGLYFRMPSLLNMLKSLYMIGFDSNHNLVKLIHNEVFWHFKDATKAQVFQFVSLILNFEPHQLSNPKYKIIIEEVEKNLQTCSLIEEVVTLFQLFKEGYLTSVAIQKLEESLISKFLTHKYAPQDLMLLLVTLSKCKRRPTPLIKAIAFQLNEANLADYSELMHIVNTVHALKAVSFSDLNLLKKLATHLIDHKWTSKVKVNGLSTVLSAMGQMNWRDKNLLDSIAQAISLEPKKMRSTELTNFVMTIAKLNFKLENLTQFLTNNIFPFVTQENVQDDLIWLDYIWSLTILKQVTSRQLISIFDQKFVDRLIKSQSPEAVLSKSKFLNIKMFAELNGIKVNEIDISQMISAPRTNLDQSLAQNLIQDILNFIPSSKYLIANNYSKVGLNIGIVCNYSFKLGLQCLLFCLWSFN